MVFHFYKKNFLFYQIVLICIKSKLQLHLPLNSLILIYFQNFLLFFLKNYLKFLYQIHITLLIYLHLFQFSLNLIQILDSFITSLYQFIYLLINFSESSSYFQVLYSFDNINFWYLAFVDILIKTNLLIV